MKYEFSARTHVGQQRGRNEDSLLAQVVNGRFIGAVADGMGGHQAGETASRLATEALQGGAAELGETAAIPEVLVSVVQAVNERILEAGRQDEELAGMGTTLTGVVVEPGRAWLVHVGDSRAYLLREGQIARLTADDSLVEELVRRGHLSAAEAQVHPQRNLLLRALGVVREVEVGVQEETLQAGDVLLLCSDGLTNLVPDRDIADIVNAAETLEKAAEKLVATANERGGYDNITVVMVRCQDEAGGAGNGEAPEQGKPGVVPEDPKAPSPTCQIPGRTLWRAFLGLGVGMALLGGIWKLGQAYFQRQFFLGVENGYVVLYQGWPRPVAGHSFYHLYQPLQVPVEQVKELYRDRLQRGILVSSPQEAAQRLQEILKSHAQ